MFSQPLTETDNGLAARFMDELPGLSGGRDQKGVRTLQEMPRKGRQIRGYHMSRHSRELAQLADDLDAERARHAEVMRKLAAQDCDRFELVPGERILASFDDVSQRTEVVREGDRVCLQCFKPIAGAKPWPAPAPAWCPACEAARK